MTRNDDSEPTLIRSWLSEARAALDALESTQLENMEAASHLCAKAIGAGGLVHMFGTGHSRMAVEEMFPRYGSYPGFHPIAELSMTFHTQIAGSNGQSQAMFIERVPGLAEVILGNFRFNADDAVIVISHSGSNAVPVEFAAGAQRRGMPVIAITSLQHIAASQAAGAVGDTIADYADVVIDLCTPPGDSLVLPEGWEAPVGPGSTLTGVAIVNTIKVRTAELLSAEGKLPPVLASGVVVGSERSEELFRKAYDEHAHRYSAIIDRS